MRRDIVSRQPIYSSFLGCEKDTETILKALFVDTKPYSDMLKRLLIINKPDCLDMENEEYQKLIDSKSLGQMIKEGYIRLNPKIARGEHDNIRAYLLINFDTFTSTRNPQFKDCVISFDVICYLDEWVLDDYQVRPLKICGYIDGILNTMTDKNKKIFKNSGNNIRMSGIGEYRFISCSETILNEDIAMYGLSYEGIHFTEDSELLNEEE